jgi:NADH-ubiquinone oxidoreductase chain 6
LASNEIFSFSIKSLISRTIIFILFILISYLFIDQTIFNLNVLNEEINSFNNDLFYIENSLILNKLYNFPTNYITILLINYLLITLIAIVKITKLFYGPLRIIN